MTNRAAYTIYPAGTLALSVAQGVVRPAAAVLGIPVAEDVLELSSLIVILVVLLISLLVG